MFQLLATRIESLESRLRVLGGDVSKSQAATALLILSGFAGLVTMGIWGEGLPAGLDMARHFWRARVESELFVATGHLDGWSPYWHLGLQQFLFQSYGYYFAIALTHRILGEWVSFLTVFKLFMVGPFLALPAMSYLLARSVKIARWAALVGAAVVLGVTAGAGFGIKGWFSTGLMLQAPGVLLIGIAVLTAIRAINDGGSWIAVTALTTGVALVTHLISGAYILSAVTIYGVAVALRDRDWKPLGRTLAIVCLGIGFSAHTLARTTELQAFMGPPVGWGKNGTWPRIFAGSFFMPVFVSAVAYFGAAHALVRPKPGRFAMAALFVGTACFASVPLLPLPSDFLNDVADTVFRPRSLPAACLLFPVMLSHGLETLAQLSAKPRSPFAGTPRVFVLMLVVGILTIAGSQVSQLWHIPRTVRPADAPYAAPYRSVLDYLRANASPPAVVAFDIDAFDRRESGSPRFASLLNHETGLFALGGDQSEATDVRHHKVVTPTKFSNSEPRQTLRFLQKRSVSWVLLRAPRAIDRARHTPGLELALSAGTVELFKVAGRHDFLSGPGLKVIALDFAAERVAWQVENLRPKTRSALLAISRHPNWQASIDGKPVPLVKTRDRLLRASIPPGEHRLELRWVRPLRERSYNLISLVSLAAMGLIALGAYRHRVRWP